MCTLAVYYRAFEGYPLIIAANRDEHFSRPSTRVQRLAEKPLILGGKDLAAGGTWLGVSENGLVAAIVNRRVKTHKAVSAPRSRGLLCLDMLRARDSARARNRLEQEDGSGYQPFLLLVASAAAAFVAYNSGSDISRMKLDAGVHVFGNTSFCDTNSEKLDHAHQLFSAAIDPLGTELTRPVPQLTSSVKVLQRILRDHRQANHSPDPKDAICVHTADYGTVSSSVIFQASAGSRFYFYHAAVAPCRGNFAAAETLKIS